MIIGADSTGKDGVNPFWTFSLALYDKPGVGEACVSLQDEHGLDVNLLLFACFAAARGRALSGEDAAALDAGIRDWRESLVRPIRSLRRLAGQEYGEAGVREALLAAELAVERVQQDRMWERAGSLGATASMGQAGRVLRDNLAAVAALRKVGPEPLESFALLVEGLLPVLVPQD